MIKINTKLILKNVHKVIILVLNVWNDKAVMKKIAHTVNDLVTPIYIYTYNNTECISQMEVYTISLINFIDRPVNIEWNQVIYSLLKLTSFKRKTAMEINLLLSKKKNSATPPPAEEKKPHHYVEAI